MALNIPVRTARFCVSVLALAGLVACGSGQQDPLVTAARVIGGGAIDRLTGAGDGAAADAATLTAATLPPALLAQIEGPLLFVETPRLGGASLMLRVGQNGPDTTWRGPEDYGITLSASHVLRSTRGLGFDLMASDVRPSEAALRARRPGAVQRLLVHLDGDLDEVRRVHDCTMRLDGSDSVQIAGSGRSLTRMTETCRFDAESYENIYWIDHSGRAIQSYQWAGERIGHLRITILRE